MTNNKRRIRESLHWVLLLTTCLHSSHCWTLFQQQLIQQYKRCHLGLETAPLIGGPSWLQLHVKVVLSFDDGDAVQSSDGSRCYKFDFVPLEPTDAATMGRLLRFQSVPAELRYFPSGSSEQRSNGFEGMNEIYRYQQNENWGNPEQVLVDQARSFCASYARKDLNLASNNCWTFAFHLYWHILKSAGRA